MNKIICNTIEFVFLEEIKLFVPNQKIILNQGAEFKKLAVTEKPVYRSEIKQSSSGPLCIETISAVTKYDKLSLLRKFAAFTVILRMKTDKEVFYVGSQHYPVSFEVSSDKIEDTYTFSCTSES